jgi:hypothetical protein
MVMTIGFVFNAARQLRTSPTLNVNPNGNIFFGFCEFLEFLLIENKNAQKDYHINN